MPPIGQIILFPYDFAPRGFSFCSGSLFPVAQNHQLFEYLGTAYGGDGKVSFGIPDIDELAPANCHYCIAIEGTIGGEYKGYCGETFPLPNNAQAENVEKCDGQRVEAAKFDQLFNLIRSTFGGDDITNFNLPDFRSTPPTKAYGYRIVLEGLSREAFLGEIILLPTNDPIMGLHLCNGEMLPAQQYTGLFGLLGYRFGGDSKTQKFALPKLYAPDNYHYYIVLRGMSPSRP